VLTTRAGIAVFALTGIGTRMLAMFTLQQRRERLDRQIGERLKTLIAARQVPGGSPTGGLAVNPGHRRGLAIPHAGTTTRRRRADGHSGERYGTEP